MKWEMDVKLKICDNFKRIFCFEFNNCVKDLVNIERKTSDGLK